MKEVPHPSSVFSGFQIWCLQKWIAYYEDPFKPAMFMGCVALVLGFSFIVADAQLEYGYFSQSDPVGKILFFVSLTVACLVFFAIKPIAVRVFSEFDRKYFIRTNISEDEYIESMVEGAKRAALLRFTDLPTENSVSMFNFPEQDRASAYKDYEESFINKCADEESRLRFKAYVAREYGLKVPLIK